MPLQQKPDATVEEPNSKPDQHHPTEAGDPSHDRSGNESARDLSDGRDTCHPEENAKHDADHEDGRSAFSEAGDGIRRQTSTNGEPVHDAKRVECSQHESGDIGATSRYDQARIIEVHLPHSSLNTAKADVRHHRGASEEQHDTQILALGEPREPGDNRQGIDRIGGQGTEAHQPTMHEPIANPAPYDLDVYGADWRGQNEPNRCTIQHQLNYLDGRHVPVAPHKNAMVQVYVYNLKRFMANWGEMHICFPLSPVSEVISMTDERPPHSSSRTDRSLDDVIDQLLPVPDHAEQGETGQVSDKIDVVVPVPERTPDSIEDDASTREELDVDTSGDGIDDIIPTS